MANWTTPSPTLRQLNDRIMSRVSAWIANIANEPAAPGQDPTDWAMKQLLKQTGTQRKLLTLVANRLDRETMDSAAAQAALDSWIAAGIGLLAELEKERAHADES